MDKKIKAFTLAETLIVLTLIGAIATLTVASTMRGDRIDEKKINYLSKKFYATAEAVYQQVISRHTINLDILTISENENDIANNAAENKSEALRNLFIRYNDGEVFDCTSPEGEEDLPCARFQSDVVAGFRVDDSCNTNNNNIFEYAGRNTAGSASNICGYIYYGVDDLDGTLGETLFMIPLGRGSFKRVLP